MYPTFTLTNMEVGTLKAMQVVTVKIPIRPTPFVGTTHHTSLIKMEIKLY